MSDYPMLISNKLHSFRNFGEQGYVSVNRNYLALLTAKKISPVGRNF